jgi:hypothetical protein
MFQKLHIIQRIANLLNEDPAESPSSAGPVWHDAGHDCPLRPDADGMLDNRGEYAVCHWDILTLNSGTGNWDYGGDLNHFNEFPTAIEDLLVAMRANAIAGFAIKPADDYSGDMYEVTEPDVAHDPTDWADPGYETDIQPHEHGGWVDTRGRYAHAHWDISEFQPSSKLRYGGDIRMFSDLPEALENLVDAMKYNYLHGFVIQPSLDQY